MNFHTFTYAVKSLQYCFVQNALNEHLTPYETSSEMPAGLGIERFAEGLDKKIKVGKPYQNVHCSNLITIGGNS